MNRVDPQVLKIPVGYKLPRWLVEWLRDRPESAAVLIENALRKSHDLTPPEAVENVSSKSK